MIRRVLGPERQSGAHRRPRPVSGPPPDGSPPGAGWLPGRAPVAVIMITLNEAHNMEAVLDNLRGWAQEVFVVDSLSTDDTVSLALRGGARVVQRRFRGFGDQWNFALRELPVTAPWTMKLDPDERLTDRLKASIAARIAAGGADGLIIVRRLWFMGTRLPATHVQTRLWRTGRGRFTDRAVNEYAVVRGTLVRAEGELRHLDSPDLEHWLDKQNQYTTAEAAVLHRGAHGVAPRLLGDPLERRAWVKTWYPRLPGRYLLTFLWHYVGLGGWRAGRGGLAWARWRILVYRLTHEKLRDLERRGPSGRRRPDPVGRPDPRVPQY